MSNARTPAPDSLILHHYDFSPFSEKIRLALGLKKLHWYSVVVPSVMPKPDLVALTGGYRHVPVMQIGADVFCDTRTIMRELDRRYPSPLLADPRVRGIAAAIEAWAERDLFWPIARYVTGVNAETVDPQLHIDRAALRGKPPPSIEQVRTAARRNLVQMRAELPIVEQMLSHAGAWLLASGPGKADLAVYHGLWFLSAFAIDCSDELEAYPMTRAWMERVAAIGHGAREGMPASEALAVAARGAPQALRASVNDDSIPRLGREVAIRPDEYTTAAVAGKLVQVDQDDVAILRRDPARGDVVVHFPRIGYSIKEL
ncbi:MAG: glutathione S-transferase family protein [Candidatus Binataceae bacterium]|jgi:glutathione S-transferase